LEVIAYPLPLPDPGSDLSIGIQVWILSNLTQLCYQQRIHGQLAEDGADQTLRQLLLLCDRKRIYMPELARAEGALLTELLTTGERRHLPELAQNASDRTLQTLQTELLPHTEGLLLTLQTLQAELLPHTKGLLLTLQTLQAELLPHPIGLLL